MQHELDLERQLGKSSQWPAELHYEYCFPSDGDQVVRVVTLRFTAKVTLRNQITFARSSKHLAKVHFTVTSPAQ